MLTNAARSVQGFAMGALAYRLLVSGALPSWRTAWPDTLLEAACLALIGVAVTIGLQLGPLWTLPLIFAFCVVVFAREKGAVSRVLLSRVLQRSGELSYAIYLVHFTWASLFYAASTATTKVPAIGRAAESLGAVAAPLAYVLYIVAVWTSASFLTSLVNSWIAKTTGRRRSPQGASA